ncbi:methyltransferase [Streptomyces violaceorubidus]|uniref:methyltransferase n=1 Tax=Streptomyces violaceorubidus TaxID=284042 RepID=UPI0004C14CE7|nr:methyltransferase [Streptomyces violaceorubidus]
MTADVQATRDVVDIITGGWRAQALYTAVRLGLPDHVAAGCAHDAELAKASGASEQGVHRLMRLLVALGVFEGSDSAGYRGTRVSAALLDGPRSLRDMCLLYGEEFYSAWDHAHHAISTESSGFEVAYGRPFYDYLGDHPALARRFQLTMNAASMFFHQVPEVFDFAGKKVVDVGGGGGNLLATILAAAPDATGTLLDRDHMTPKAREHLTAAVGPDRAEVVGGDMFEGVPEGGDVYILCRVLAGHDDEDVVGVFEHCRRAMAGPSSRLLVLDRFVADEDSTVLPALWDLHLLVTTGGEHRTLDRIARLLERAGLSVESTAELPMETTALIVAARTP